MIYWNYGINKDEHWAFFFVQSHGVMGGVSDRGALTCEANRALGDIIVGIILYIYQEPAISHVELPSNALSST